MAENILDKWSEIAKDAALADCISWSKTDVDSRGTKLSNELIKITFISGNEAIYCTFDVNELLKRIEFQRDSLKIGTKND